VPGFWLRASDCEVPHFSERCRARCHARRLGGSERTAWNLVGQASRLPGVWAGRCWLPRGDARKTLCVFLCVLSVPLWFFGWLGWSGSIWVICGQSGMDGQAGI